MKATSVAFTHLIVRFCLVALSAEEEEQKMTPSDVMVSLAGIALMVIGVIAWLQLPHAKWPVIFTIFGAIIFVTSGAVWVWNMPDHIRGPLVLAAALLLAEWLFVSLPVFLLLGRRHVPLWMRLYVFLIPAALTMVFFLVGPLEAVWVLFVLFVGAVVFFWIGPGSLLRQEYPPPSENPTPEVNV